MRRRLALCSLLLALLLAQSAPAGQATATAPPPPKFKGKAPVSDEILEACRKWALPELTAAGRPTR